MILSDSSSKFIEGWPIILILYFAKKIPCHIKLQKMLFLMQSEAKIPLPYDFKKADYGPYDQDIKIDFQRLDQEEYIDVSLHGKPEKTYWIFRITKKGEKYAEDTIIKGMAQSERNRIERFVTKYMKEDWKDIVEMVYEKYNLSKEQLNAQKEMITKEFSRIRPIWSSRYEKDDCEYIFTTLAMIDYITILLNKKRLEELDITQYNVLINFLRETATYLKNETASFSFCSDSESCDVASCERFSQIMEMFLFIQYLGEKFGILPSTFSEDAYLEDFNLEEADEPEGDDSWKTAATT